MIQCVYDFLSILFDKLEDKEKIRGIVLFGSVARGEQRKDSDIDLFVDVQNKYKPEVDKIVKSSLNEFEIKAQKSWYLRGIKNHIVPIVDDIQKNQWKELKTELESYGKIVYGNLIPSNKKDKSFLLVEYDLSKLKQKNKMRILRALYGYKIKQNGKIYAQKGLFQEEDIEKISNAAIIPSESQKRILDFLTNNRVSIKARRIQA